MESEALEGQVLDDERVDFDGIGEEIPEELLNKVAAHTSAQSQNGQVKIICTLKTTPFKWKLIDDAKFLTIYI